MSLGIKTQKKNPRGFKVGDIFFKTINKNQTFRNTTNIFNLSGTLYGRFSVN